MTEFETVGTAMKMKGVKLSMEELHLAYLFDKLRHNFGFLESVRTQIPVNGSGETMPMYTYPCYEYLNSMNWEGADVFEYGTGFSTIWWKNHGANIYGVEHNKNWYEKINGKELGYITLENSIHNYPHSINIFDKQFDVIVIDGLVRYQCVPPALKNLKSGGIIIFDNSDWHSNTKELLDTKDLIPIHFHGFKPTHVDSQTTSIYMHKEFSRKAKSIIPMGGTKRASHMTDKPKDYQPKVGEVMQGRLEELEYSQRK
jgi:hypothetical protein|tara:strand:- start:86 stop:856 length:771 start_codon:yes stop_codon:yes gene_type:complete